MFELPNPTRKELLCGTLICLDPSVCSERAVNLEDFSSSFRLKNIMDVASPAEIFLFFVGKNMEVLKTH